MPEQISRLLIFFLLILIGFFVLRPVLVPDSYGDIGRYRAAALGEIRAQESAHIGNETCVTCHDGVAEQWTGGRHNMIACESCHGPGAAHGSDPNASLPNRPTEEAMRQFCGLCHHQRVARPEGFPQVDIDEHNFDDPCTWCHGSHEVERMSP